MNYRDDGAPHYTGVDINQARLESPSSLPWMIKNRVSEMNKDNAGGGGGWAADMQRLHQSLVMMGYSPAHASRLIEESAGVKGLGMGVNSGVTPYAGETNPFGPAIGAPYGGAAEPSPTAAAASGMGDSMLKAMSAMLGYHGPGSFTWEQGPGRATGF